MKVKEKVNFYTTEDKSKILFSLRAEKVMDIHGKYFVEDSNGKLVGYFRKEFGTSLIKSTWYLFEADGTKLLTITESSRVLAIARRYLIWVPIIGDVVELVLILTKYHFIFYTDDKKLPVGKHRRISLWRDRYTLFASDKMYRIIDKRMWTALGVTLDMLQSR